MATGYTAPLRDMRFMLEEIIGIDSLAALEGLDSLTPDLVNQVLDEAGIAMRIRDKNSLVRIGALRGGT